MPGFSEKHDEHRLKPHKADIPRHNYLFQMRDDKSSSKSPFYGISYDIIVTFSRIQDNGLYQFAYVQYHMLFMTAVYYALLKVYCFHEKELKNALYYLLKDRYSEFWKSTNTKSGKLYFGSFAAISESDVFMLLSVVGLDNNLLGELQKLVKERNQYAHANGQLQLTSYELFIKAIKRYNEMISKVIILLKQDMINFYLQTISDPDFYDPDIRAYIDNDDQIVQEFIRMYSLSRVELNWLRKIKVSRFDDFQGKKEIQDLHIALMHYYDMLYEDDCTPIEDPYLMFKYKGNAAGFVEKELGFRTYPKIIEEVV